MALADQYKRRAAECVRMAERTENADDKALLLQMAQTWMRLAERPRTVPTKNNGLKKRRAASGNEVARRRAQQVIDEFGVAPVTSPRSPDILKFFWWAGGQIGPPSCAWMERR